VVVGAGRDGDDGVVAEIVGAGPQIDAADGVAVAVGEVLGAQTVAERERLKDDGVVAIGLRAEIEQQARGAGDFVGEAAADAHGQVVGLRLAGGRGRVHGAPCRPVNPAVVAARPEGCRWLIARGDSARSCYFAK